MSLDDVDLADLTASLRRRFAGAQLVGYLDGRTALRDAVAAELRCSELQAEEIVDTLVERAFVHYEGDPASSRGEGRAWSFPS